jgi:hypothetical protein
LQHRVPYTPQHNGVSKRKKISLKEMNSCMLYARYIPYKLWVEEINCVYYIQNKSPHRSIEDRTPFEAWTGEKLDVTHFCIFGCHAWDHIPSEKRKALDPCITPCIFVGYPNGLKGYNFIHPSTN